jgi:hypothetical protein
MELPRGDAPGAFSLHEVEIMRIVVKALLLAGFCAMQMEAAPAVSAAELAIKPIKKASVRVIQRSRIVRHRQPIVRDYDGTAVVMRRYRTVALPSYDGTVIVKPEYELVAVRGAQPTRYLNGEPVLPNYPRWWPQTARTYDLRISVRSYPGS